MDLINYDEESSFSCPECGPEPNNIVMDGITLGMQRRFLQWLDFLEEDPQEEDEEPKLPGR